MPPKETPGDVNFNKVINELKKLNREYPTIRFGSIIQMALDNKKRTTNFDLNNVSSKELLTCLGELRINLKSKSTKKINGEV